MVEEKAEDAADKKKDGAGEKDKSDAAAAKDKGAGAASAGDEQSELQKKAKEYLEEKFDENTGKALDPGLLADGRRKEWEKLKAMQVYDVVPRAQANQDPNGKKIRTRWVDIMKGEIVKSRFVAQEIACGDPRDDLFLGRPRCSRRAC